MVAKLIRLPFILFLPHHCVFDRIDGQQYLYAHYPSGQGLLITAIASIHLGIRIYKD